MFNKYTVYNNLIMDITEIYLNLTDEEVIDIAARVECLIGQYLRVRKRRLNDLHIQYGNDIIMDRIKKNQRISKTRSPTRNMNNV